MFVACEEPPRPAEGSLYQLEMSGYLAARGDFTHEYDNFAEMDLREIAFNPEEDPAEKGELSWCNTSPNWFENFDYKTALVSVDG